MKKLFPSSQSVFLFIGAIILLCYYAFYNNYPILYCDTGTYIYSGFEKYVPDDRPIIYGIFLRHISLGEILWLVVLVQALIVEYILILTVSTLLPKFDSIKISFFISAVLAFFTGISFHVSQIIPDIFTSVLALSLFYLLVASNKKLIHKIVVTLILLFSVTSHNSHLVLSILLLLPITLLFLLKKDDGIITLKNLISCWVLIISCWFLLPAVNYFYGGKFKISKASHIFIMARMDDNGVLGEFLLDNCKENKYKICEYKNIEYSNLIWDNKSPVYKTGGWNANEKEYNDIIKETILQPKYLLAHIHKGIEGTLSQLFDYETGDAPKLVVTDPAIQEIRIQFRQEFKQAQISRQFFGRLSFKDLNHYQSIFVLFSSLFIIFVLTYKPLSQSISNNIKFFTYFILFTLVANAATTAIFSYVLARYQSRVIWLIPLTGIIYLLQLINKDKIKARINTYFKITR